MMTHDRGGIGAGNRPVVCRHDNQEGNRYCDACGADRGRRRCPLCASSNRDQAKFCRACGARLLDEGVTPETTVARGGLPHAWEREASTARDPARRAGAGLRSVADTLTQNSPARSGGGMGRHHDPTEPDMAEEDEWVARDRRRPALLLVAAVTVTVTVAIAIAFGISRFGFATFAGPGRAGDSVVASQKPAVAARRAELPVAEGTLAAAAAREPVSASAPMVTTEPGPPALAETPAPPAALPPPSRSLTELPASRGEKSTPAQVRAAESSEERVADFLIEQFGPATAVEKALSTAAWYEAGRPERAYWQRVAEAVRHRSGS
jgi:hypothetical protein